MKSLTLFAATITLAAVGTSAQTVYDRRENQQDRIAQGVASGQLTAGETARLEGREANLNREIRNDRAVNGGSLTAAERAQINRQQNALSNSIYADKHNAYTQHYGANEVDARRWTQQQRIAQGIRSGSLSAGEASRLEHQEHNINQEVWAQRGLNGGRLTPGEHALVNRQMNGESARIYAAKHNAVHGPR